MEEDYPCPAEEVTDGDRTNPVWVSNIDLAVDSFFGNIHPECPGKQSGKHKLGFASAKMQVNNRQTLREHQSRTRVL